ncbi:MAG TPA: YoaK family protein [Xanthobacteraceae bacterium]|jgi:uncharacterized membrane protein YoaK (UPF0700 family)
MRGERPDNGAALTALALAALALCSGTMDVASFLMLGNVFTSAMTGNTALLGFALSQGNLLSAAHSFSALIGFIVGAALAAIIGFRLQAQRPENLIRALLAIETLCLVAVGVMLTIVGPPGESTAVFWLILVSAVAMGIQGITARYIHSPGINTIVFTSTLISIVISLAELLTRRSANGELTADTKRQIGIFLAYGFGAVLAGLLIAAFLPIVGWIPVAAVLIALGCCEAAGRKS